MKLNFSHQEFLTFLRSSYLTDNPEIFTEPELKWGTAFYEDGENFKIRLIEVSYKDCYLGWEDPFMGLNYKLDECFFDNTKERSWHKDLEFNSPKELMEWFLKKVKTNEVEGSKGTFSEVRKGKNKRKG